MGEFKSCFRQFAFYDRTGIEEYLEHMALRGWKVVKTNLYVWKFERIEPQKLRCNVSYFPKASMYDPKPTDEQEDFVELCKHAGWELAAEKGELKVFYNEDENAVPIETDPLVELQSIKKACRENFVLVYLIFLYSGLTILGTGLFRFFSNRIDFLSNDCAMLSIPCAFCHIVVVLSELMRYTSWCKRAQKVAEENGEFVKTRCVSNMLIVVSALAFAGCGFIWGALAGGKVMFAGVLVGVLIIATLIVLIISTILRKSKVSAKINHGITYGLAAVAGIVCVIFISNYIESNYDKKDNVDSSVLISVEKVRDTREEDGFKYIDRAYTVTTVKADFVYDFVKSELLKVNKDAYSEDVDGNIHYAKYQEVDGGKWNVDKAYQSFEAGESTEEYVLCKDNVIVKITDIQSEEDIELILSRVFE